MDKKDEKATEMAGASEITVQEKTSDPIKISSKKRRKDKLQPIATPDIQFETITLDDDPSVAPKKKKRRKRTKKSALDGKVVQAEPPKPMALEKKACDAFLEDPETEKMLREIAEERVRINYLLASFGMPDINFLLGDTVNTLDNQLSERFRQRNRKRGTMS